MLGKRLFDPHGVEGTQEEIYGLDLLDVETTFDRTKTMCQVEATLVQSWKFRAHPGNDKKEPLKGYEIHMGRTTGDVGLFQVMRLANQTGLRATNAELIADGSAKGNVWGTYIHGIFDNDLFRHDLIDAIRVMRGMQPSAAMMNFGEEREKALERWTDVLRKNIDIESISSLVTSRC